MTEHTHPTTITSVKTVHLAYDYYFILFPSTLKYWVPAKKKKNVDQVIRQESLKFSSKPACWDQEGNLSIVLSKMGWPYAGLIDCFSYNGPYTS